MGAPVSKITDIYDIRHHTSTETFPQLPPDVAAMLPSLHRDHIPSAPPLFNACVAKPVSRKEREENPDALKAVAKEWHRLRTIKHKKGVGVWG